MLLLSLPSSIMTKIHNHRPIKNKKYKSPPLGKVVGGIIMSIKIENKKICTEELVKSLKTSLEFDDWNYTALWLETHGCELVGEKYWKEYRYNNNEICIFWDTASHNAISIRINDERIIEVRK